MTARTYLDYNATAPLRPSVRDAMANALSTAANPSSIHREGVAARRVVTTARAKLAAVLNIPAHAVVFTSGGTEANNTVLGSFSDVAVFISAIEHDSVRNATVNPVILPVDTQGRLKLDVLEAQLAASTDARKLVSVMLANNETGVLQDIPAIAKICHAHGADLHTDATQAFGKLPLDMMTLGADYLTLCGHKVGAPVGVGAIVGLGLNRLQPLLRGGAQEQRLRAGTENVLAIAGLAALLDEYDACVRDYENTAIWQTQLEDALPEAVVYSGDAPRLYNTLCLGMPGVAAETQLLAFDLDGIAVSAGSACSSGKVTASPVLTAMGAAEPAQAIRVSTGWNTTENDITHFIKAWRRLYQRHTEQQKAA